MYYLKSLSIENYRGFVEEKVNFATPKGNNGSGLTLIAGPNNTGKTSLIEALMLKPGRYITRPERWPDKSPKIISEASSDSADEPTICQTLITEKGSSIKAEKGILLPNSLKFGLVSAKRKWPSSSPRGLDILGQVQQFENSSAGEAIRMTEGYSDDSLSMLASFLGWIDTLGVDSKDRITQLMRRLVPHFTDWYLETDGQGRTYVEYEAGSNSHEIKFSGGGIMSLFRICAHLVSDGEKSMGSGLIIDEPELSLHPSTQKILAEIISEESRNRQIIVCTHSPYFVNWRDYSGGAEFVRLNKFDDLKCEISQLGHDSNYSELLDSHLRDWQKPHLLDVAAKEIMFAENILFVEGQEDMGLIRRWMTEANQRPSFEIFGYGVGGHGNMRLFLKLAEDLSLRRVVALYDRDEGATASFDRDRSSFANDWLFLQLDADDIRDKEWCCSKSAEGQPDLAKSGCFDASGRLKPGQEAGFRRVMSCIFNYFNDELVP